MESALASRQDPGNGRTGMSPAGTGGWRAGQNHEREAWGPFASPWTRAEGPSDLCLLSLWT